MNIMHEDTKHEQRIIAFSPPDITESEIEAVAKVLRSGWITTGPRTKELEQRLRVFTKADGLACLNSATVALECALRLAGIGSGDEVIVPAYTYTATAASVIHVGATPILVDVAPNSFLIDPHTVKTALSPRTKAIMPVDIAGRMADYDALFDVLDGFSGWQPTNDVQACLSRPLVIADAAHALGATYGGKPAGSVADFTAFSFHAVKNFTTAEGGALAWRSFGIDSDELYDRIMLLSLHGQTKDALHKDALGNWEYDIVFPGYKWNMTDIAAAMGLVQLDRCPDLLACRAQLVERYQQNLATAPVQLFDHAGDTFTSSMHLMLTRIEGATHIQRNQVIEHLARAGVASNVHYKPLPLLTAYRHLGADMAHFTHAFAQYENEITLPLHTLLTDDDVDYVCEHFIDAIAQCCSQARE